METLHRNVPYKTRMTLGVSPKHDDMFHSSRAFCEERLDESSVFRFLADEGDRLFPDEAFADLFKTIGRRSVAPRIVAAVMVLQRLEGLSDREATERFIFDVRWKYAAGVPSDFPGFVHTVLVDMRERLRHSDRPNRIFEIVLNLAKKAGFIGRKRVLDSTALYDAVATQDTVTLIRGAIRGVLRAANIEPALVAELRRALRRDDDYVAAGKPVCDWDDRDAREALIDGLARDGHALLAVLDGRTLAPALQQAVELLVTVTGQDLERT
jgi:transposase